MDSMGLMCLYSKQSDCPTFLLQSHASKANCSHTGDSIIHTISGITLTAQGSCYSYTVAQLVQDCSLSFGQNGSFKLIIDTATKTLGGG